MIYHIALLKGYGRRKDTVVLQARRNVDFLDCEVWRYLGKLEVTKKALRESRDVIREWVNKEFGEGFTWLVVD